jgi:hypothetical protein
MLSSNLLSSPPRLPPSRGKERRNPSITPRKFRRFFTPRSRVSAKPSAARKALHDLGAPALNRCQTPSSPLKPISEEDGPDGLPSFQDARRGAKRRKIHHSLDTPERAESHLPSPLNTSPALLPTPNLRPGLRSPIRSLRLFESSQDQIDHLEGLSSEDEEESPIESRPYTRPVPLRRRGLGAQLVQRMTGGLSRASDQVLRCPVSGRHHGLWGVNVGLFVLTPLPDWRTETADFYSKPEDVHLCSSHEGAPRSIPFCTTSCHSKFAGTELECLPLC